MPRIDKMSLQRPFYGSRRIRDWLKDSGFFDHKQTGAASYALDGDYRSASESNYKLAGKGEISRHLLHADGEEFCVCGGHHGLVKPQGIGLTNIEHEGCWFLRGCAKGSHPPLWPPKIYNTDRMPNTPVTPSPVTSRQQVYASAWTARALE